MTRSRVAPLVPWLALGAVFGPALAVAQPAESASSSLRQVAGVLDYIGGDYREAVDARGEILHRGEYDEQLALAGEADALAAQAGLPADDPLRATIAELTRELTARASPARIAALCRRGRELLVERHRVDLSPRSAPSLELGARLYAAQGCATCHGADGSADTPAARELDPPPADFLDPARVAAVSPHRAFYAISFGVEGTGMQGYPQLSDAERWSLAFFVLSMRHRERDLAEGARLVATLDAAPPTDPASLSAATEEDLLAQLGALASDQERAAALAYLRAGAPFAPQVSGGDRFALARQKLAEGLAAYRSGDVATARRLFVSAYLDGFEPHEAAIAARDAGAVREIEAAMLGLRQELSQNAPAEHLAERVEAIEGLLARVEPSGEGDAGGAFAGALAIALREGLEIALLVGALLGLVRRRGAPQLARYVHGGWLLAIPAGLLTWWGAAELLGGLQRELAEGIAALLAAVVLLGVTHWLFGQLTARRFMGFVSTRMQAAVTGRTAALGILALSFLAAYREAFEIVLFYQALLLDAGERVDAVWLGAGAGLAILLVVTWVLKRLGQRLPLRGFMLLSSGLLALLSFMLIGKGVRALQEAAVLDIHALPLPELPLLGVYATSEGLIAQGLLLCILCGSALAPLLRQRREPQPAE